MTETTVLLADNGLNGGATTSLSPADQATEPENNALAEKKSTGSSC